MNRVGVDIGFCMWSWLSGACHFVKSFFLVVFVLDFFQPPLVPTSVYLVQTAGVYSKSL